MPDSAEPRDMISHLDKATTDKTLDLSIKGRLGDVIDMSRDYDKINYQMSAF